MTTYAIRTEGAALNFYSAIVALAQQAPEIERAELVRIKHNTQTFAIRCSRARMLAFAAAVIKNWTAFGGGAKPAREKKTRSTWPTRALSVLKSCLEDGDLSAVRRIALDELGGFVVGCEIVDAEGGTRSITTILVSPEPVEGWEDLGIVVAYEIATKQWVVTHQASGLGCGGRARTKKAALEAFSATIGSVGEAFARDKLSAAGSNPYTTADWDAEHLAVDATVAQAAAEDATAADAPETQEEPMSAAVDQAMPEADFSAHADFSTAQTLPVAAPSALNASGTEYTITIKPLSTRGKPYAIVRCPSSDGYKTRAARLASSIARDRYSHRQGGYVMSTAAAARFEALYAEGADACAITGNVYTPLTANDVIEQTSSVAESGAPVADTTCSGIAPASPEYVALRSAAREARRAALAAIDTARVSSAQALRELTADDADYSYLIPTDGTHRGGVHAAKNIRLVLKKKFPGVKFKVTSDYSRCSVKWTDGPTDAAVCEALAPFDIGASDSQSDYFYTVATRFSDTYGGVQYLFTSRELGAETIRASIVAIFGDSGPTFEEWEAGRAWSQLSGHGNYGPGANWGDEWAWLAMVRRHANGLDY